MRMMTIIIIIIMVFCTLILCPSFINTLPLSKDQEMTRDSDAKARAKIPRVPS